MAEYPKYFPNLSVNTLFNIFEKCHCQVFRIKIFNFINTLINIKFYLKN
jgi:hypothetical protein